MTKNYRPREVPVSPARKEVLQRTLDFMQQNRLKSLAPTKTLQEQYHFAERVRKGYIKETANNFRYHDLRHTYVRVREREGATEKQIMSELGHGRSVKEYHYS